MNDDAALLRQYAEEGSEAAFTELVRRHVDLVYGAALRRTDGDPHQAADVAQQVFTMVAQQARKLSRHPVLSGWLHTATRHTAINLMISERRRKTRETEALALESAASHAAPNWDHVRPELDAAIDDLPDPDRDALVLRFLEQRPFAEIGTVLRVTEDAARMRTDRALDKLRAVLARRGISSTAAAFATLVAAQPSISAPAGLAASLASTALTGAGVGIGLATATTTFIMSTKTIATAGVIAALGLGLYFGRATDGPRAETAQTRVSVASSDPETPGGSAGRAAATSLLNPMPAPVAANAIPAPQAAVLPNVQEEQRVAITHNLRQIAAGIESFQLENGRPPASMDELVGPDKFIKRLVLIDGEDYGTMSLVPGQPLTVTTRNGVTAIYERAVRSDLGPIPARPAPRPGMVGSAGTAQSVAERLGPERMQRITTTSNQASAAYRAANNGKAPPNLDALLPYFSTPQEGADFVEYLDARKLSR